MKKIYRIYRYTNILNGMKYVGSTSCKYQSNRSGANGRNYYLCPKFGEAINEYGWSNFKYEVLEDGLTKEEAFEREKYWIEKENSIWPNGYNIQLGGAGTPGTHPVRSDEWRKKQSESHKGHIKALGSGSPSKRVLRFTKDNQFIAEYSSISEASRQTGIERGNISKCCQGKPHSHTAGESIWKYA